MSAGPTAPEAIVWTDAAHADLIAATLHLMGDDVRPIGVGGPRVPEVDALAKCLDVHREDDLRKLVVDRPAAFLLLGTLTDAAPADLQAAATQGTLILALEPLAADLAALSALTRAPRGESHRPLRAVFLPALTHAPGYLQAANPHEVLGEHRLIVVEHRGPERTSSLFARLFDAWHSVLEFAALPESIDASLAGPLRPITDDLRRLSGRMAAHARLPDGGTAVVVAGDRAAEPRRRLHVAGGEVELHVTDTSYDLRRIGGDVLDRAEPAGSTVYADLIARQWRRLLDRPDLADASIPPHRDAEALSCCMACLLSARTGQPESPRKLMEMNR